jgi:hypothetical protein
MGGEAEVQPMAGMRMKDVEGTRTLTIRQSRVVWLEGSFMMGRDLS